MQPYNYSINVPNPVGDVMQNVMQGANLASGIQQMKENQTQKQYQTDLAGLYGEGVDKQAFSQQMIQKYPQYAQATMKTMAVMDQQEQAKNMQIDLGNLANNPNATAQDYSKMMIKYPQLSEQFKRSFDVMNEDRKNTAVKDASSIYAAINSGNVEVAKNILNTKLQAAQNSGLEDQVASYKALLQQINIDPNSAKATAGLFLASSVGADNFSTMFKQLGDIGVISKELTPFEKAKQNKELLKLDLDIKKAVMDINRGGEGQLDVKDKFDFEKKLRDEYIKGSQGYFDTNEAYNKINAAEDNAVGDISLIFSYMKMLDPSSVVREGEFATAQNATGVPDRVINLYNNILQGTRLNPNQRKDFRSQAKKLLDASQKTEQQTRERVKSVADNYKLDTKNIFSEPVTVVESRKTADGKTIELLSDGTYREVK